MTDLSTTDSPPPAGAPADATWVHHPTSYGVMWEGEQMSFQCFGIQGQGHLWLSLRRHGQREWTTVTIEGEFGPIRNPADFKEAFAIYWGRQGETALEKTESRG